MNWFPNRMNNKDRVTRSSMLGGASHPVFGMSLLEANAAVLVHQAVAVGRIVAIPPAKVGAKRIRVRLVLARVWW